MLDRLRLSIPFSPEFVTGAKSYLTARNAMAHGHRGSILDIHALNIPLGARAVALAESEDRLFKDWDIDGLYHKYESLPSSFTPLAFKVFHDSFSYPCIELKASPAKLLQGHNVFGTVDIALGAAEMLSTLQAAYPVLFSMLEVSSCQVMELDCTYSARMKSEHQAQQVMNVLKKVSNGQTKSRGDEYQTTTYWGSKASRLKRLKAYLKCAEFFNQLDDFRKDASKGCEAAKRIVAIMEDQRLQDWTRSLIRFEATVCKRYLERREISCFLPDLIKHQRELKAQGRCFISELWQDTTKDVFAAFEGQTMRVNDDDAVLDALRKVHFTITPKGNVSYSKASRLFLFFVALREQGYTALKKLHAGNKTFYRNLKELQEAGFSKAFLQNLHGESKANVIPLLRFVEVDFGAQRPDWYEEPISQFIQAAA